MLWFLIMTWVVQSGGVPISNSTNADIPAAGGVPISNSTNADIPAAGGVPISNSTNADIPAAGGVPISNSTNADIPAGEQLNSTSLSQSGETLMDHEVDQEMEEEVEEGDILLSMQDRNTVSNIWPTINGSISIPYEIPSELTHSKQKILKAFNMISEQTCVRFHNHTTELNYLKLKPGRGCASYVGCRGGAQRLYYSDHCSVGNLCHEFMHALGLHHEHTRKDRGDHIIIHPWNVFGGKLKNFLVKLGNLQDLPYDINSIMHYGKYYFSKNRKPTITYRKGESEMGQRKYLTLLDIEKVKRLYRCGKEDDSVKN